MIHNTAPNSAHLNKKPIKVAMIAPGYGNQSVGMGKEFYDSYRLFQENFEHASQCLGYNVTRLCFAASSADLLNPAHSYVAQFVHSHTIAQMLREDYNIVPDTVVGYGIGTVGALSAARVLNFVDGIYASKKFLEFCAANTELIDYSSYRVSSALYDDIQAVFSDSDFLTVKHVSSDSFKTHIISGTKEELKAFVAKLKCRRKSVRAQDMGLGHGLGLDVLEPVVKQFKPYLNKLDFNSSTTNLLSCVDARLVPLRQRATMENELLRAISSPINWPKVVQRLNSYDFVIVLGPSKLIKAGLEESIHIDKLFFCDSPLELDRLQQHLKLHKFLNESDSFSYKSLSR